MKKSIHSKPIIKKSKVVTSTKFLPKMIANPMPSRLRVMQIQWMLLKYLCAFWRHHLTGIDLVCHGLQGVEILSNMGFLGARFHWVSFPKFRRLNNYFCAVNILWSYSYLGASNRACSLLVSPDPSSIHKSFRELDHTSNRCCRQIAVSAKHYTGCLQTTMFCSGKFTVPHRAQYWRRVFG